MRVKGGTVTHARRKKVLNRAKGFVRSELAHQLSLRRVPEIAFEVAVIIRCLLKDGFIKDVDEFVDFVKKYATDPQYGEVK